jgi:ABC-2 type transport system permease protein
MISRPSTVKPASFRTVLSTEFAKLRRSGITWISFAVYIFLVGVAGFFMWMLKNPGMAEKLGLLGQKAQLVVGGAAAGWSTYLGLVLEMSGIAALVLCSFVLTYLFGREYVEGTAKNMLALPVARWHFVAAKLLIALLWCGALTLWELALTSFTGLLVDLGPLTTEYFTSWALKAVGASLIGFTCSAAAAWIAVMTRGYLAPLGYVIFSMLLAVVLGATEWGKWAPWSILMWFTGASGPGKNLVPGSFAVITLFFALTVALIIHHETRADNVQ